MNLSSISLAPDVLGSILEIDFTGKNLLPLYISDTDVVILIVEGADVSIATKWCKNQNKNETVKTYLRTVKLKKLSGDMRLL